MRKTWNRIERHFIVEGAFACVREVYYRQQHSSVGGSLVYVFTAIGDDNVVTVSVDNKQY